MGWVSLVNTTPESFSAAKLNMGGAIISHSVTLHVNPANIFVAQISLTALFVPGVYTYIAGITLQNGDYIDLSRARPLLNDLEWSWAESVTFVLTRTDRLNQSAGSAWALATVTTYMA